VTRSSSPISPARRARRSRSPWLATYSVPLATPGTAFQQAVWEELRRIPAGVTRSYAEQARALGRPDAVRAVARANGDNRLAIVIPSHRVIGSDGRLTGYGGGVAQARAAGPRSRGRRRMAA